MVPLPRTISPPVLSGPVTLEKCPPVGSMMATAPTCKTVGLLFPMDSNQARASKMRCCVLEIETSPFDSGTTLGARTALGRAVGVNTLRGATVGDGGAAGLSLD